MPHHYQWHPDLMKHIHNLILVDVYAHMHNLFSKVNENTYKIKALDQVKLKPVLVFALLMLITCCRNFFIINLY